MGGQVRVPILSSGEVVGGGRDRCFKMLFKVYRIRVPTVWEILGLSPTRELQNDPQWNKVHNFAVFKLFIRFCIFEC